MADDIVVTGAEQLERLARQLRETGNGELRKELLRGIRQSTKGTLQAVRESAGSQLPRGGGLADRVAGSKFSSRTRTAGRSVGVRLTAAPNQLRGIKRLDFGDLRHPLFGNRQHWFSQSVRPRFLSRPIEERAPQVRSDIQDVMNDVARKIERSV